jgi:hypothetical protein
VFGIVALNLNTGGLDRGTWLYIEHRWLCSLVAAVCSVIAGTFYGELAMWLGIGRKWTLASYAAIGAMAMYLEFGISMLAVTVMLPLQFAVPFAVGRWFIKRRCEQKYAATKVLVFAISPVLALLLLSSVVILALHPVQEWIQHELCKQWTAPSHAPMRFLPAALDAAWYASILLKNAIPTALASLLYCKLAKRVGLGRKWIFISCTVIVTFEAMGLFNSAMCWRQHSGLLNPLMTCRILADCIVPPAIGWWFLRRKHDQGQLQLAS